jgi:hypothetical protein
MPLRAATFSTTARQAAASGPTVRPPARWATWLAHAVVWIITPTALWRLPFAFGYDMGMIDPEAPPWAWWAIPYTVGLILLTEGLAFLTVGLVSPWGEVMPSWLPRVGGRPVRPRLVVGAAATGGLALSVLWISDGVNWFVFGERVRFTSEGWERLASAGLLTHVVWGPMLLAVTFDYWRRHRHP